MGQRLGARPLQRVVGPLYLPAELEDAISYLCKEKVNERTLHRCTDGPSRHIEKEARHVRHYQKLVSTVCMIIAVLIAGCDGKSGDSAGPALVAAIAPTTYSAYTGTDAKRIPPAPALGPVNSVI